MSLKKVTVPQLNINNAVALKEDRTAIQEKNKEIAKALWSGKLSQNEQAAINQLCIDYGLNPITKPILMLGGNVYITAAAITQIGNQWKVIDERPKTMIFTPATNNEREAMGLTFNDPTKPQEFQHCWKFTTYRKNGDGPFEEFGIACFGDIQLHGKNFKVCCDMAKTRAKNRTLKNMYSIGVPSVEEIGWASDYIEAEYTIGDEDKEEAQPVEAKEPEHFETEYPKTEYPKDVATKVDPTSPIATNQRNRIFAEMKRADVSDDERKNYILHTFGETSMTKINYTQAEQFINYLKELPTAIAKTAAAPKAAPAGTNQILAKGRLNRLKKEVDDLRAEMKVSPDFLAQIVGKMTNGAAKDTAYFNEGQYKELKDGLVKMREMKTTEQEGGS